MKDRVKRGLHIFVILFICAMGMMASTEDVWAAQSIKVTISIDDTAKRIEGTTPVVKTPRGYMLKSTDVSVDKTCTAKEAIVKVLENNFKDDYVIEESTWGAYIKTINGLSAGENGDAKGEWGDTSGWTFLVNGEIASTGISGYELKDNDIIRLSYSCTGWGDDIGSYEQVKDHNYPNPDSVKQKLLIDRAKKAEDIILDYVYKKQLDSGSFIPNLQDDAAYVIFSLIQGDYKAKDDYYESYYKGICNELKGAKDDTLSITGWSKLIMVAAALGKDPHDIGGHNAIDIITNKSFVVASKDYMKYPTILLAIDMGDYKLNSSKDYLTREEIIYELAKAANEASKTSDIDMMSMNIQPLSRYYDKNATKDSKYYDVKTGVENVIQLLEVMQQDKGHFNSWGTTNNPWTQTQVMIVLGQYNINPLSEEQGYDFIKDGNTVIDAMNEIIDFDSESLKKEYSSYDPVQFARGYESILRCINKEKSLFSANIKAAEQNQMVKPTKKPSELSIDDNANNKNNQSAQNEQSTQNNYYKDGTMSPETADKENLWIYMCMLATTGLCIEEVYRYKRKCIEKRA